MAYVTNSYFASDSPIRTKEQTKALKIILHVQYIVTSNHSWKVHFLEVSLWAETNFHYPKLRSHPLNPLYNFQNCYPVNTIIYSDNHNVIK